jgi:hypothetical protein
VTQQLTVNQKFNKLINWLTFYPDNRPPMPVFNILIIRVLNTVNAFR